MKMNIDAIVEATEKLRMALGYASQGIPCDRYICDQVDLAIQILQGWQKANPVTQKWASLEDAERHANSMAALLPGNKEKFQAEVKLASAVFGDRATPVVSQSFELRRRQVIGQC